MKKPLPIGLSDFKKLIDAGYVYVDKSLFIKEFIETNCEAALITRMRRFGKTLGISMLRYFFEKTSEDTSYLFKDLAIWKHEHCRKKQGQFPVIFLSLKDVKHGSWQKCLGSMREVVAKEFRRHDYLLESESLKAWDKAEFNKILLQESSETLLESSLKFLTEWLHKHYNQRVILLIDEYDTPAQASYVHGYYKEAIEFLRNWLSGGYKDNASLEKGVLTGILRVAKEDIFSGLNNITTFTILDSNFSDKFGLTESEVAALLCSYDLEHKLPEVKAWYNGYLVGETRGVYNPWSVLQCIEANGVLDHYWVGTSDNALMKQLLTQGNEGVKQGLEVLMRGESIEQKIEEGVVFAQLKDNPEAVWALLLYSGYLSLEKPAAPQKACFLRIPNIEVKGLYTSMIMQWFQGGQIQAHYHSLLTSLTTGDVEAFAEMFKEFMLTSVSLFDVGADEPEKIYHALVLGMLIGLRDHYEVRSNRESGYGRYDVMMIPRNPDELGIILEFKKVGRFAKSDLREAAASALKQIEERNYARELLDRGVKRLLFLGLAFQGKEVEILSKFR